MTFITIITVIFVTPVYAQSNGIGYSTIHPASPFYFLKSIREILELKFAGTSQVKNLRQLEFATRRLREAKTLLTKSQDLIPPTLERYISHLNTLTDKHQKNDEFAINLKDNLAIHLQVLEQIYEKASNLRAKMAIRTAMNRIIQRADVPGYAKAPVCNFFAKEASSSALNQTEKFVLQERVKKCLRINN